MAAPAKEANAMVFINGSFSFTRKGMMGSHTADQKAALRVWMRHGLYGYAMRKLMLSEPVLVRSGVHS
jgi:hypothetical protein